MFKDTLHMPKSITMSKDAVRASIFGLLNVFILLCICDQKIPLRLQSPHHCLKVPVYVKKSLQSCQNLKML